MPPAMLLLGYLRGRVRAASEAPSARNRSSGGRVAPHLRTFSFGSRTRSIGAALLRTRWHWVCRCSTEPSHCRTRLGPDSRPACQRAPAQRVSTLCGSLASQNSRPNHCRPHTHPPTSPELQAPEIGPQKTQRHVRQQVARLCPRGPAACRPEGRRRRLDMQPQHFPAFNTGT